jgi:hypothetical protein
LNNQSYSCANQNAPKLTSIINPHYRVIIAVSKKIFICNFAVGSGLAFPKIGEGGLRSKTDEDDFTKPLQAQA